MNTQEMLDGLTGLGFTTGFVISGDPAEITFWENEVEQPTVDAIALAVPQGVYLRNVATVQNQRREEYMRESDPLFFQYQRGEKTKQEWLDAIAAINDAYPYPVKEEQ